MPRTVVRAVIALAITVAAARPVAAAGRRVFFVDNSRAGGAGTFEQPFATLAEAEGRGGFGDVIFVAETATPYQGGISLKKGQMLIGSAYGLDAIRAEEKIELDAPGVPAAQGPGPSIHGIVTLAGDNIVAGCTFLADRESGGAINAFEPHGFIALKKVFIRSSEQAFGLTVADADGPLTITGGGLVGTDGNGIVLNRGRGVVVFDRFQISGTFASALFIGNRTAGSVTFKNLSKIDISDAHNDAITLSGCDSPVTFDSTIQVVTHGGRGFVITQMKKLVLSGGTRIDATNAAALEIRDSGIEATFQRVSAQGIAPGRITDGILINKLRGHLTIAGAEGEAGGAGVIRNTQRSGMTIEQSSGVRVAGLSFIDNGSGTRTKCEGDVPGKTNLLCRAAVFLRHVSNSEFEDLTIEGGGQVGINANNISNVRFGGIQIHHVGAAAYEPGVLIDELVGDVKMSRCHIEDTGGGGLLVEQRFNSGRILMDRCTIAQGERPGSAPYLLQANVAGEGKLSLELTNIDLHDNAASAIRVESSGRSSLAISLSDSVAQRLGGSVLEVLIRQDSHARVTMRSVQITAPGIRDRSLVDVQLQGAASEIPQACVDLRENRFYTSGGGRPAIHLASQASGVLMIVGPAGVEIEGIGAMIERVNAGSSFFMDVAKSGARVAPDCAAAW